eukprot:scaffold247814_cov33-Prasinocladus_malaysianus.AAC.1
MSRMCIILVLPRPTQCCACGGVNKTDLTLNQQCKRVTEQPEQWPASAQEWRTCGLEQAKPHDHAIFIRLVGVLCRCGEQTTAD